MDSKNLLIWRDYTKEDAALVDSWLDADAVRLTALDEGFDEFRRYWENESDPARGEYFRCKLVSENTRPFAVIAFGYCSGTVTIMEIVVDPALRGQGRGTALLREFIKNAADWIKQPISVFEAVVFENNPVSQIAFYKAGFVRNEKDRDRWHKKADDSEMLFRYTSRTLPALSTPQIRWLEPDERRLFNAHLRLCNQNTLSIKKWNDIVKTGIRYCGLFVDSKMVARACIEKLTDRYWEISDVRVAQEYRNRGYATAICGFAANEILSSNHVPTIRTEKDNAAMLRVIHKFGFLPFTDDLPFRYQCKIASLQEMDEKWNYEIARHPGESNWIIWKEEAINDFRAGRSIPYYGILDGTIICEATAMLDPTFVQNGAGMMDDKTAYLCAFRTVTEFQGKGYFSKLLRFLLNDLNGRGFTKAILGVEPEEEKNKAMYRHWGFTEYIKSASEQYPDGRVIQVEYYRKQL